MRTIRTLIVALAISALGASAAAQPAPPPPGMHSPPEGVLVPAEPLPTVAPEVRRDALADLVEAVLGNRTRSATVRQRIDAISPGATLEENALFDRVLTFAQALEADQGGLHDGASMRRQVEAAGGMLFDLAGLYPDDFRVQLLVATELFGLTYLAEDLGVDVSVARQQAVARAEALVARFPDQARAHTALAVALCRSESEELVCLRAWAACLAVDPGHGACLDGYRTAAAAFTRERCSGDAVRSDLAVYEATSTRAAPGARPVMANGRTYFLPAEPVFVGDDVARVEATLDRQVVVFLRPESVRALRDLTAQLAVLPEGLLAFVVEDQVLAVVRTVQPLEGGRIGLRTPDGIAPFCRSIDRPALPEGMPVVAAPR